MKANREKRNELAQGERFAMKNLMLDKQIELKSKMKKILNDEQFAKWSTSKKHIAREQKKRRKGEKGFREKRHGKRN